MYSSAWIPNTDLSDLDPESCKDAPEKGKTKALIAAYVKAAENNDLDHYKDMLREHSQAMEEEVLKQEAAKSAKKPKAEKKKRKSDAKGKAEDDDDVDMEEADGSEEVKKSSKKRKKAVDSDDEGAEKVRLSQ